MTANHPSAAAYPADRDRLSSAEDEVLEDLINDPPVELEAATA